MKDIYKLIKKNLYWSKTPFRKFLKHWIDFFKTYKGYLLLFNVSILLLIWLMIKIIYIGN